jgi:hypothetical protein
MVSFSVLSYLLWVNWCGFDVAVDPAMDGWGHLEMDVPGRLARRSHTSPLHVLACTELTLVIHRRHADRKNT